MLQRTEALEYHRMETSIQAQLPSGWTNLGNSLALSGLKVLISNKWLKPSDFQNHFEICERCTLCAQLGS